MPDSVVMPYISDNELLQRLCASLSYLQHLPHIETNLAQLVSIEQQRLENENNIMPPAVIQALIDLLNKFVVLVQTDATNLAASEAAKNAALQSLSDLQAADAAAAALVPAAQAAIDAANAASPPV